MRQCSGMTAQREPGGTEKDGDLARAEEERERKTEAESGDEYVGRRDPPSDFAEQVGHASQVHQRAQLLQPRRSDPGHCVELVDRLERAVGRAIVEDLLSGQRQDVGLGQRFGMTPER